MENTKITITKEEKEVFDYLNCLRECGITNMFGAGTYIREEFGYGRKEASEILSKWMKNFNKNGYDNLVV